MPGVRVREPAKFILKCRTVETSAVVNRYRGRQVTYGSWRTVRKYFTLEEAQEGTTPGLYSWAVFHRGRKVWVQS